MSEDGWQEAARNAPAMSDVPEEGWDEADDATEHYDYGYGRRTK